MFNLAKCVGATCIYSACISFHPTLFGARPPLLPSPPAPAPPRQTVRSLYAFSVSLKGSWKTYRQIENSPFFNIYVYPAETHGPSSYAVGDGPSLGRWPSSLWALALARAEPCCVKVFTLYR